MLLGVGLEGDHLLQGVGLEGDHLLQWVGLEGDHLLLEVGHVVRNSEVTYYNLYTKQKEVIIHERR